MKMTSKNVKMCPKCIDFMKMTSKNGKMSPQDGGTCKATSNSVKIEKRLILSISGAWDLSKRIPRAISDRMALVSSIFVGSRAILAQNKVPRALSTVFLVRYSPGPAECAERLNKFIFNPEFVHFKEPQVSPRGRVSFWADSAFVISATC